MSEQHPQSCEPSTCHGWCRRCVSRRIKVLGMVASPEDLPPLNVEREKQRVEARHRAVAGARRGRGDVAPTALAGAAARHAQGPMERVPFSSATPLPTPYLDEGTRRWSAPAARRTELTATPDGPAAGRHASLRLVVLNACEAPRAATMSVLRHAATLIRRGLPAVVAMQYEITIVRQSPSRRRSTSPLADGLPIDASVAEARKR